MIGTLFFICLLLFGIRQIFAATFLLLAHRSTPDDEIVVISKRQDPANPWVTNGGFIRGISRTKRRKWIILSSYALLVLFGFFESMGAAFLGLAVVYGLMMLVDLVVMQRS